MHQSESRSDEKATIRAHRAMRTGSERERHISQHESYEHCKQASHESQVAGCLLLRVAPIRHPARLRVSSAGVCQNKSECGLCNFSLMWWSVRALCRNLPSLVFTAIKNTLIKTMFDLGWVCYVVFMSRCLRSSKFFMNLMREKELKLAFFFSFPQTLSPRDMDAVRVEDGWKVGVVDSS